MFFYNLLNIIETCDYHWPRLPIQHNPMAKAASGWELCIHVHSVFDGWGSGGGWGSCDVGLSLNCTSFLVFLFKERMLMMWLR